MFKENSFGHLNYMIYLHTVQSFHVKALGFIAGNCVLCYFNSEFTNKINKMTKIFAFLSVLYVVLLIFFVNSLLKQRSTQLPAM
jgi:hypothetical protein